MIEKKRILVGITGASGIIYAKRLVWYLSQMKQVEVRVILSPRASEVIQREEPEGINWPEGVTVHGARSMNVPFVSGSNTFDAMVVVPCSMGSLARIAHGTSDNALLRAADVILKERRRLILVARETPFHLIHLKNMEILTLAGATVLPANPSFYFCPKTVEEVADTVVSRILDHLGVEHSVGRRWADEGREGLGTEGDEIQ